MGDAARFERLDIRPRHVLLIADEAAKQQAHMARLNRDEMFRLAGFEAPRRSRRRRRFHGSRPLGDFPTAVLNEPIDKSAYGIGKRLLDREVRESPVAVRLG